MKCPNNCPSGEFFAPAVVSQTWRVDRTGEFIAVSDDCVDVITMPHKSDDWTCAECSADAISDE